MDKASLVGSTLSDRYRLLEVIGEGGMGWVFRAEQLTTGETVAVKLLHPEFVGVDQVIQRFEREAKVTTELSHPNIVNVVEFGAWKGHLFLAMELLAGRSLADLIGRNDNRGTRLTIKRTVAIMRPVLDALEYAHNRGVVHRDLKPENIMVIPPRGLLFRETVKLLDFGIAKLGDPPAEKTEKTEKKAEKRPKLTQNGMLLGTPGYMSPEQAIGRPADVRSDVYACGVVLYEMLTGRRPFEAESPVEVLAMHLNTPPPAPRGLVPEAKISPAVEAVILRALAKEAADRFQSAPELRHALERALASAEAGPIVSGTDRTVLATAPAPRRNAYWMEVPIIAASLLLLLGHHLPVKAPLGGDAPSRGRAVASTEAPPPPPAPRSRARRSGPESARDSSERAKNGKPTRTTAKKPPRKP